MTQYEEDQRKVIKINDGFMSVGIYNLIISIRDVKLWQSGMRPHKNWKLKHVKEYFGVLGSASFVLNHLENLKAEYDQALSNIDLQN